MIKYVFLLELPHTPPPHPTHPPTPSPFGQAGQLTGNLSATASLPIFVLWADLCHVDGTWKTAIHRISKEKAVPLSPIFVFLSPVHIYTAMSLCTSLLLLPVYVHAEMLIYDQLLVFPSDVMHVEVRIITSSCRTKYTLYSAANIVENLIQHSHVQYFSFLTCLKTR